MNLSPWSRERVLLEVLSRHEQVDLQASLEPKPHPDLLDELDRLEAKIRELFTETV